MSEEQLLGEIKRHIDYTNAMNEKSLRDLQIENLYNLLQQKENIIKEVREYIKTKYDYVLGDTTFLDHDDLVDRKRMAHILEILDKENK